MKITAIKQQVKRAGRYSIYLDGKYSFSLSDTDLLQSALVTGQDLSSQEVARLKDESALGKGYDRTLNLIAMRPRSEGELRQYLKRKDFDGLSADAIIEKLRTKGYIDDEDFARRWVESRRLLKATSKRRLSQELKQKYVSDDIIRAVLEADETDEVAVLRELIERKRKQTKYQDTIKLMQYLTRQGFNYDTIKQALQDNAD
jgi:regulatory protein